MNLQNPVYTEKAECQDCYKCVRHCPVKAIKVENGSATVIPERCIACGHCVAVCPVHAKRVRQDQGRVQELLGSGRRVIVSLAPSYVTEFADCPADRLVTALRRLGFYAVSETALGAQEVSAGVANHLWNGPAGPLISSACPVVVELIHKYLPAFSPAVMNLCSPLLAHARLLKRLYGNDAAVVFIGPCIGKKKEADAHPELLAAALTFRELRTWFESVKITPARMEPESDSAFVPGPAAEGVLYPVDGGMIAGIRANCAVHDQSLMAFSGLDTIRSALQELASSPADGPFFLELLACPGGCVNGPGVQAPVATVAKRRRVLAAAPYAPTEIPRPLSVALELDRRLPALPERAERLPESELRPALASIGKYVADDELNCGGCGYGNCREFAGALLAGHAERTMCVSYMRKLAQNKANALIRAMPSGVVIVDDQMRVVECNARFARLLGEDAVLAYDARPGLEGVQIAKLAPFLVRFFERVMGGGDDLLGRTVRGGGRVYRFSLFGIEARRIAGCVLQDVTEPAVQKEQVVREAREVIRKNLATVQKIAYLLGENAAESQATLNAIIESFSATALTGAPAAELAASGGEEAEDD